MYHVLKHRRYFQVEKYVQYTKSAIAGYWLGSVMNHNRSEGKFLWFPPTNPSQENGKSPKFSNNHYKMSKTLHILKHDLKHFETCVNFFFGGGSFIDVISCRCRSQRNWHCNAFCIEWSGVSWAELSCELFFFFCFFWGIFFFKSEKKMCRSPPPPPPPPPFEFAAPFFFFGLCAFSWMALVPFCLAKVPSEV